MQILHFWLYFAIHFDQSYRSSETVLRLPPSYCNSLVKIELPSRSASPRSLMLTPWLEHEQKSYNERVFPPLPFYQQRDEPGVGWIRAGDRTRIVDALVCGVGPVPDIVEIGNFQRSSEVTEILLKKVRKMRMGNWNLSRREISRSQDSGSVVYFLGFNVHRNRAEGELYISQEHYMEALLDRFDFIQLQSLQDTSPLWIPTFISYR